jgi:hypothetical protein
LSAFRRVFGFGAARNNAAAGREEAITPAANNRRIEFDSRFTF